MVFFPFYKLYFGNESYTKCDFIEKSLKKEGPLHECRSMNRGEKEENHRHSFAICSTSKKTFLEFPTG
jgi:ssDNA-binding Zn-finger/Zn-ribbon topoisomerase 1